MNKIKVSMILLCVLLLFPLISLGCGSKELDSASIVRDDLRTGGSLSFVYDKSQRVIYIGGEDEIVQFSEADETKGLAEGCRIGLKVTAPNENIDLNTATLEMNGINYSSGNFLETINGQKQRFFNIYPIVSKEDDTIKFSITWQDGTKEQEYKIVMVSGTKYMQKDGSVE